MRTEPLTRGRPGRLRRPRRCRSRGPGSRRSGSSAATGWARSRSSRRPTRRSRPPRSRRPASFDRPLGDDRELLQRERKEGVPELVDRRLRPRRRRLRAGAAGARRRRARARLGRRPGTAGTCRARGAPPVHTDPGAGVMSAAARINGDRPAPDHEVVIVGSGFAGLGMAIELRRQGISDDFVVLERAATLGGTWRDNRYPGCACDVPAPLYSFSFAPNPDWSRMFAPHDEIRRYLERLRRSLRRPRAAPLRDRGHRRRLGRASRSALWRRRAQRLRVAHRPGAGARRRRAEPAADARGRGPRALRRSGLSLGRVGRRGRARRQAGRRRRHRRQRDPDRPAARPECRRTP